MADPLIDRALAGPDTDPQAWAALFQVLPNPDFVLRRLGRAQEAYDGIGVDAHVLGEMRSIRAGLLSLETRVVPGEDSRRARRAADLAAEVLAGEAAPGISWPDAKWSMAQAVFRGHSVQEVLWERRGSLVWPLVVDRPNRRFSFDRRRQLRLLTRDNPFHGVEVPDRKFILCRHMPSDDNPYGVAVLSACFWPWSFKRVGWQTSVKFVRKFGLPWPIGKYPAVGADEGRARRMVEMLLGMLDSGVVALPDDEAVEFQQPSVTASGQLPHERLVGMANREMSKALTSQTLATEIEGQGSRAASETHHDREREVQRSDRTIPQQGINRLLRWTTDINFGEDVAAPRYEYVDAPEPEKDWAETIDLARRYIDVPVDFAHERLAIPMPKPGQDVLERAAGDAPGPDGDPMRMSGRASRFAASRAEDDAFEAALEAAVKAAEGMDLDGIGRDLAGPIVTAAREDPVMLLGGLAELHPSMSAEALQDLLAKVIFVAKVWGRISEESGA